MLNPARLKFLSRAFSTAKRSRVFMDISIDEEPKGRLVFELFDDIVPKTAANFKKLCIGGDRAKSKDVPLHYKGTAFHRIFEGFMCQGGDITTGDGTGGESIYGPTFPDENYKVELDKPGVLAMLNKGPNTNSSLFLITFIDCSFLDNKYVGLGEVVDGHAILNQIEYCGNSADKGKPKKKVQITDCGEISQSHK